ncbi:MAG: sporulation transcriptional regulator SpoIIID [Clostridia bacterium]|nr:sporulation transcriptional regulator SpoIIID [Clostridia bacterium]
MHGDNGVSRCEEVAKYIVESGATVRAAAKKFGMSKSTVHKEVTVQLRYVNRGLYAEVREILEKNKAERHLRGGEATKKRYAEIRRGRSKSF